MPDEQTLVFFSLVAWSNSPSDGMGNAGGRFAGTSPYEGRAPAQGVIFYRGTTPGNAMKFPRRLFLHLAGSAVALPVALRIARAQPIRRGQSALSCPSRRAGPPMRLRAFSPNE